MLTAFGAPPSQSRAEHGITELLLWSGSCSTSVRPPGWKDFKLGSMRFQLWELSVALGGERTSCQHESMRTITSWPAEGAACLVCIRKLLLHVLSLAAGKAKPEQHPAMSLGWRDSVQAELQRVDSMGVLKHKCVFFCHPTTWFWVLSFSPAIFFLCCNYCWECDPACWLWCHAHFLCRSWGGWWWFLTRKQSWAMPSNERTTKCCKHRFCFLYAKLKFRGLLHPFIWAYHVYG